MKAPIARAQHAGSAGSVMKSRAATASARECAWRGSEQAAA
jgi:hypothetical protein